MQQQIKEGKMFNTNKNWVDAISKKDVKKYVSSDSRILEIRERLRTKKEDLVGKLTTALMVETAA